MGKWGNGEERKRKLREAGYNYESVQSIVNALVAGNAVEAQEQVSEFEITGTETMEIEVDLTKYNGIKLSFVNGSED